MLVEASRRVREINRRPYLTRATRAELDDALQARTELLRQASAQTDRLLLPPSPRFDGEEEADDPLYTLTVTRARVKHKTWPRGRCNAPPRPGDEELIAEEQRQLRDATGPSDATEALCALYAAQRATGLPFPVPLRVPEGADFTWREVRERRREDAAALLEGHPSRDVVLRMQDDADALCARVEARGRRRNSIKLAFDVAHGFAAFHKVDRHFLHRFGCAINPEDWGLLRYIAMVRSDPEEWRRYAQFHAALREVRTDLKRRS